MAANKTHPLLDPDHPINSFLTTVMNLILLNILTLICLLPVVTGGAALTALSSVLMEMVRGGDAAVIKGYFRAFKKNFHDATMVWVFYLAVIVLDLTVIVLTVTGAVQPGTFVIGLLIIISVLFGLSAIYAFALTAHYRNTAFMTFRNSWILMIGYLPKTVIMLAAFGVMFGLLYKTWPYLSAIGMMFGISFPMYASMQQIVSIFRMRDGKPPEIPGE